MVHWHPILCAARWLVCDRQTCMNHLQILPKDVAPSLAEHPFYVSSLHSYSLSSVRQ